MMLQLVRKQTKKALLGGVAIIGFVSFAYVGAPLFSVKYNNGILEKNSAAVSGVERQTSQTKNESDFVVTHIPTPDTVKALYMTSWVAGTKGLRDKLLQIVDETEINSLVIDIKDYSGTISFELSNPKLKDAEEIRIPDIKEFISELHKKQIYVIGRITVFQDPLYAKANPEQAVQKESDKSIWKDYKGLSFVDAGSRDFWDYIVDIAKESHAVGFDELNFDYIRFPSDGNMKDVHFPISEKQVNEDPAYGKAKVLKSFFKYLRKELAGSGVVMSADLFGMASTNRDDLNIGQVLEYAEPYFDYISPMVYPSHYPKGFNGYQDVNKYPYEIVKFSMDSAVERMIKASSSPQKIRPWLQDFDYPVIYTEKMVRDQIRATYDAGLTSWMLWDPSNTYTRGALLEE